MTKRDQLRETLSDVINGVLAAHPRLRYYQGFHDVCSVFMLIADENLAFCLAERCASCHLRDFMQPSLKNAVGHLELVMCLLSSTDGELYHQLTSLVIK